MIKRLSPEKLRDINTTRNRSKFSPGLKPYVCDPRCTSGRPATWACIIWCGKSLTTLSTKRWPVTRMRLTSLCTRMIRSRWSTTAVASPSTCTLRKSALLRKLCSPFYTPAENSTATLTKFPAVSTESAFPLSTLSQTGSNWKSRAMALFGNSPTKKASPPRS